MVSMGVYFLPFLPRFLTSPKSTLQAAWRLSEPEKVCIIGLTNLKYEFMELVKQLCTVSLFSINIMGVLGRLPPAAFPTVQQTPDVCVKCLLRREPRTQSGTAGVALRPKTSPVSSEVREGSREADGVLDPRNRHH